jgi:hypothetical protein
VIQSSGGFGLALMRCVFKVGRGQEWVEDRPAVPIRGTTLQHLGQMYTVAGAEWWFGGSGDELELSDSLILLEAG